MIWKNLYFLLALKKPLSTPVSLRLPLFSHMPTSQEVSVSSSCSSCLCRTSLLIENGNFLNPFDNATSDLESENEQQDVSVWEILHSRPDFFGTEDLVFQLQAVWEMKLKMHCTWWCFCSWWHQFDTEKEKLLKTERSEQLEVRSCWVTVITFTYVYLHIQNVGYI